MRRVYLDHNATSPLRPEVRSLFVETLARLGGNPSSVHAAGREARALLDTARERTAAALGVQEDEVIFTSGGTEANNLALFGALGTAGPKAGMVTTAAEHASVLEPARRLEDRGHPLTVVPVDRHCRPDIEALLEAADGAALVSVMAANNEVGTRPPLGDLARGLRQRLGDRRPLLHTDAVQALGRVPVRLRDQGLDLASFSTHKLGGPLGCGVLYRRTGVALESPWGGGGQEADLRPGTENVPAIVAGALAIELAVEEQAEFADRARALTTTLWNEVLGALPDACSLGPPLDAPDRLPNTLSLSLPGVDAHVIVAALDLAGLEVSAGSACASGSLEPSHVLLAMGLDADRARAGLRLSVGWSTTAADIHNAVDILSRSFSCARKS